MYGEGWTSVGAYLEEVLSFSISERGEWHSKLSHGDTDNVGDGQCNRKKLSIAISQLVFEYHRSSQTNAATMSQSSALEPEDFVFRRKCRRNTTAMHASAMKMALVATIARDAAVVMLESCGYRVRAWKERI